MGVEGGTVTLQDRMMLDLTQAKYTIANSVQNVFSNFSSGHLQLFLRRTSGVAKVGPGRAQALPTVAGALPT